MGIYDREYYRREGPGFLAALTERGKVCKWLIGINVVVFLISLGSDDFVNLFLLNVAEVREGEVWRLLTYAFLHATRQPWHILFNMLFLWWFGTDVEDIYGPWEFLAFYLVAAVLGGVAFFLWELPQEEPHTCLGASGAVTAVLVLCALHYPTRVILVWFIPVQIWLFVLFQVISDVLGLMGRSGHTAFVVHLAGAGFAFLYYKSHLRLMSLWPNVRSWQRQRTRPQLRVYHEEEETPTPGPGAAPGADVDEQLEAKLDAVLEKVARTGQSSLTENERQILLRASEVYKRRRT
jgi:membrane associated rhomboid family serine protease